MRPNVFHSLVAAALIAAIVAGLFAAVRPPWTWYHLLAAYLLAVNVVTFAEYGFDKARARSGGRRVPEIVLHGLALCGGTLGAYLGMRLFRHKTMKPSFRIVFWLALVLWVMLIMAVAWRLWAHRGS